VALILSSCNRRKFFINLLIKRKAQNIPTGVFLRSLNRWPVQILLPIKFVISDQAFSLDEIQH